MQLVTLAFPMPASPALQTLKYEPHTLKSERKSNIHGFPYYTPSGRLLRDNWASVKIHSGGTSGGSVEVGCKETHEA